MYFYFQERIARAHGSQCGFCTPGIVMSMYALLRNNPTPKMADMEEAFQGRDCQLPHDWPVLTDMSQTELKPDWFVWMNVVSSAQSCVSSMHLTALDS